MGGVRPRAGRAREAGQNVRAADVNSEINADPAGPGLLANGLGGLDAEVESPRHAVGSVHDQSSEDGAWSGRHLSTPDAATSQPEEGPLAHHLDHNTAKSHQGRSSHGDFRERRANPRNAV